MKLQEIRRIEIENFRPIREACLDLGEINAFVGEQGTGKSLVLQLLKLIVDLSSICADLGKSGAAWDNENVNSFLFHYLGGQSRGYWEEDRTRVRVNGEAWLPQVALQQRIRPPEVCEVAHFAGAKVEVVL